MGTTDGLGRDNRVLTTTRVLSTVIVPFLLVAFYLLYLRTAETGALFAWEISAPMTSRMLAPAYLGGAYFFTRAISSGFDTSRWFAWVYLATGLGLLVVTPVGYAWIERRLTGVARARLQGAAL